MAYTPHTLVAFGGTLNTNQARATEIWQCGVRVDTGVAGNVTAYFNEVSTALSTWYHASTMIPSSATLDWCKVNPIGPDGKYANPTTNVHDYSPKVLGGGNSASVVDIITLAISWTTAVSRGPGHAGRIFLPLYSAASATSASMVADPSSVSAALNLGKGLLNVLSNTSGTVVAAPGVYSKINGAVHKITGVRVGDVLDVQRRRKDALKEVYTASVWP